MARLFSLAAVMLVALTLSARAETFLLMAEEKGCMWCARWNSEIGHIYSKTDEGRTAPLRRYDVHKDTPKDVDFAHPVRYTPTFVLVKDGAEVGRIEGYPGEDFFWGLLGKLFERAQIETVNSG